MSQPSNTANPTASKSRFSHLWDKLTTPPLHHDPVTRAQSRLLSSILVASGPLTAFLVIINTVLLGGEPRRLLIGIITITILLIPYWMARQGNVVSSTLLMVFTTTVAIYGSMFAEGSEPNHLRIVFLLLPLLYANIVLRLKTLLMVGSTNIVILLSLATILPSFQLEGDIFDAFFLYVVGFSMLLVVAWFRNRTEAIRRNVLHDSETRYRTIFETAHDAIFIHEKGVVVDVNPKFIELFETTREALNNWEMLSRIKPDPRTVLNDPEGLQRERRYEFEIERLDGSLMPIVLYAKPIRYQDRDMRMLIIRDITTMRDAEQRRLDLARAQERNQLLEQLMADMSHDLKTPLSVIRTTIAVLSMDINADEKQTQIKLLQRQVDHFERLFLQILTISGLDYATPAHYGAVNLNTVIENIVQGITGLINRRLVQVKTDLAANLLDIQGDSIALQRAISNLVENSIHYSPPGAQISVQTRVNDTQHIEIQVADRGLGISEEDLPHIFDRYYRGQQSREQVGTGTGLGLAIVKRVVELPKGEISVTSSLGEGTTFTIRLPAVEVAKV